jgi:hypothetical protein
MIEVVAKARSMGASDADIERWLDIRDVASGATPRHLIAAGRAHQVIEMLKAMDEGVFA